MCGVFWFVHQQWTEPHIIRKKSGSINTFINSNTSHDPTAGSTYVLGLIVTYIGVFSFSKNTSWSDQSFPFILSDSSRSKFQRTLASTIFISTQASL